MNTRKSLLVLHVRKSVAAERGAITGKVSPDSIRKYLDILETRQELLPRPI